VNINLLETSFSAALQFVGFWLRLFRTTALPPSVRVIDGSDAVSCCTDVILVLEQIMLALATYCIQGKG